MAGLADRSELPFVHLGLRMARAAAKAIFWTWFEGYAGVAVRATNCEVLACEFVVALTVVIEDVLAGLQMAALALFAETPAVGVILFVATGRRAVGWRLGEFLVWMALCALCHAFVQPQKRPLGVIGMIKAHCRPASGLMTALTVVAQAPEVQRVIVTAHTALSRCAEELIVLVALVALDSGVAAFERPVLVVLANFASVDSRTTAKLSVTFRASL